jgi:hypothetical protein
MRCCPARLHDGPMTSTIAAPGCSHANCPQSFNSAMQLLLVSPQKCTMTGWPLCAPVISCQLSLPNVGTASVAKDAPGVRDSSTAPSAAANAESLMITAPMR